MLLGIVVIVVTVLFIMHRWLGVSNAVATNMNKRMTKDPMLLTHHYNCLSWEKNIYRCNCYMQWVQEDMKELDRFRETTSE
jgi:hypothetical protein